MLYVDVWSFEQAVYCVAVYAACTYVCIQPYDAHHIPAAAVTPYIAVIRSPSHMHMHAICTTTAAACPHINYIVLHNHTLGVHTNSLYGTCVDVLIQHSTQIYHSMLI